MNSPNRNNMNGVRSYTSPSYGQNSQSPYGHQPPPYSQPPPSAGQFGGPQYPPPQDPMSILRPVGNRPTSPLNLSGIRGVGNAVGIPTLLPGNQPPGTMSSSVHRTERRELYRVHNVSPSHSHSSHAPSHSVSRPLHCDPPCSPDSSPRCIPFRGYAPKEGRLQTPHTYHHEQPPQYLHCRPIDDHILSCFIDHDRDRHL